MAPVVLVVPVVRWVPSVALLLAGGAHLPLAAQASAGARPPSELAVSGTAQKQAYAELAQRHETELRQHAMHPMLVARPKGQGATLVALRTAWRASCAARPNARRPARRPRRRRPRSAGPPLQRTGAGLRPPGGGGGPVPAEWMAPLQGLSGRMKPLHAAIADAAAPGWDCEAVARALARERSELATLSRR